MSNKVRPVKSIKGEQASRQQREIAELLNPEIEINRKKAILKSPQVFQAELICFRSLPEKFRQAVEQAGLEKELLHVPVTTYWQAPRTGNVMVHFLRWISKYDKPNPHNRKHEFVVEKIFSGNMS